MSQEQYVILSNHLPVVLVVATNCIHNFACLTMFHNQKGIRYCRKDFTYTLHTLDQLKIVSTYKVVLSMSDRSWQPDTVEYSTKVFFWKNYLKWNLSRIRVFYCLSELISVHLGVVLAHLCSRGHHQGDLLPFCECCWKTVEKLFLTEARVTSTSI